MGVFVSLCIFLAVPVSFLYGAQAVEQNNQTTWKELVEKVDRGDSSAILEIGKLQDQSAIPYLEKLLLSEKATTRTYAQMAMAKLGDKTKLHEILTELQSGDAVRQDAAINKLIYIGGGDAVRPLIALLNEKKWRELEGDDPTKRGPKGERRQGDVVFLPLSYMAMKALSRIVPNPPVAPSVEPKDEQILIWKRWWSETGVKMYAPR